MNYEDKMEYDDKGRIIYEEHSNGFWEKTTYYDYSGTVILETHYPNGVTETERYVNRSLSDFD